MKITTNLSKMKNMDAKLEYMKKNKIIIGVIGEGAEVEQEGGLTIAQYAELNEYGTSDIPARPFFREATEFGDSVKKIKQRIYYETSRVIQDKKTSDSAMKAIGLFVKGRIQTSIKTGNWTPNSAATARKKLKKGGGVKPPLIDTGSLIRAIDFEIKRK